MKIRCSALGKIMTNPRTKADREAGLLSDTTKSYCLELLAQKYGRYKDINSKYLEKGLAVEEDSITLLSLLTNTLYLKNEDNLQNEFITGTPDIVKDGTVHDIKSSWSLESFLKAKYSKLDKGYELQLQGYMALTGCKQAKLHYCLVNATATLIDDEKRRLFYQYGDTDNPKYINDCQQVERNMIYDLPKFMKDNPNYDLASTNWSYDIPAEKRLHTIDIDYNFELMESVYERVKKVNEYLSEIDL